MVLTRAYPMMVIAPAMSRLVLDRETTPSQNSKVNPIETQFVSQKGLIRSGKPYQDTIVARCLAHAGHASAREWVLVLARAYVL